MKKLILPLFVFAFYLTSAQSFVEAYEATRIIPPADNLNGLSNSDFSKLTGNPGEWSKVMLGVEVMGNVRFEKIATDGSVFLFDDWKNQGMIQVGNKKYVFSNINFNIYQGKFMTKTPGDSIFIFDILSIDKIMVNNRSYRSFYNPAESKNEIFEVLYEDNDISLLKNYSVKFIEASTNPMVNRPRNKIVQSSHYYIYKNKKLEPFKLKKANILGIVNADKMKKVDQFVKKNRLSYKDEDDLSRIMEYAEKI